jgi:hypothetical protein
VSLQRFWSDEFAETVGNVSFKIQPVTAEVGVGGTAKLRLAYNLRYFWDGFNSAPPGLSKSEQSEGTHGFVVSFTF